MEKEFVSYEIALELKNLKFDEPCLGLWRLIDFKPVFNITTDRRYSTSQEKTSQIHGKSAILAPLWQQVIDWFRKKCQLDIHITYKHQDNNKIEGISSVYYDIEIYKLQAGDAWKIYRFQEISDNYYEAREQTILKTIELCKNNL